MFLPISLLHLGLHCSNGFSTFGGFEWVGLAATGVMDITGATPAFVAVSRHNAFSSLLSSLWGSHLLRTTDRTYVFANRWGNSDS